MIGRFREKSEHRAEQRAVAATEQRAKLEADVHAAATSADRRAARWALRRHDAGQWLAGLDPRLAVLAIVLAVVVGSSLIGVGIAIIALAVSTAIVVVFMGWAWAPIALIIGWVVMWRRYRPAPLGPRTYVRDVWARAPRRPMVAAIIGWVATLVLTVATDSVGHIVPLITGATSALILGAALLAHYRQHVTGKRSRSRRPRRDGGPGTDLTTGGA